MLKIRKLTDFSANSTIFEDVEGSAGELNSHIFCVTAGAELFEFEYLTNRVGLGVSNSSIKFSLELFDQLEVVKETMCEEELPFGVI
jgi:hypothetical protein